MYDVARDICALMLPSSAELLRCSKACSLSTGTRFPSLKMRDSSQWALAHPSEAAFSYQVTAPSASMSSSFPVSMK